MEGGCFLGLQVGDDACVTIPVSHLSIVDDVTILFHDAHAEHLLHIRVVLLCFGL